MVGGKGRLLREDVCGCRIHHFLIFFFTMCGEACFGVGGLLSWNLGSRYKICSEMISCFSVPLWMLCIGDVAAQYVIPF